MIIKAIIRATDAFLRPCIYSYVVIKNIEKLIGDDELNRLKNSGVLVSNERINSFSYNCYFYIEKAIKMNITSANKDIIMELKKISRKEKIKSLCT